MARFLHVVVVVENSCRLIHSFIHSLVVCFLLHDDISHKVGLQHTTIDAAASARRKCLFCFYFPQAVLLPSFRQQFIRQGFQRPDTKGIDDDLLMLIKISNATTTRMVDVFIVAGTVFGHVDRDKIGVLSVVGK